MAALSEKFTLAALPDAAAGADEKWYGFILGWLTLGRFFFNDFHSPRLTVGC